MKSTTAWKVFLRHSTGYHLENLVIYTEISGVKENATMSDSRINLIVNKIKT